MVNVLPQLLSFCVHEDIASVGPRWKQWLKRFEMFLANHDVKDATRQRALLLYSAGEEVSDIFETFPHQGEEKDYAKAVAGYFWPKVNKGYESYMLRNATPSTGESLDSYCALSQEMPSRKSVLKLSNTRKVNAVDEKDDSESTH